MCVCVYIIITQMFITKPFFKPFFKTFNYEGLYVFFSFYFLITFAWFFTEALKKSSLISAEDYEDYNISNSIYNLVTLYVYSFVLFAIVFKQSFLMFYKSELMENTGLLQDKTELIEKHFLVPFDSITYFVVLLGAAFVFANLGEVTFLQFSLSGNVKQKLELHKDALYVFVPLILVVVFFIIRKVWDIKKKKRLSSFFFPIIITASLYAAMYMQCSKAEAKCGFHLHHAFIAGFLFMFTNEPFVYEEGGDEASKDGKKGDDEKTSILQNKSSDHKHKKGVCEKITDSIKRFFFSDISLRLLNFFFQACTLGVFVQGINFYGSNDLRILTVEGGKSLSMTASIIVCVVLLLVGLFIFLLGVFSQHVKNWWARDQKNNEVDGVQMSLLNNEKYIPLTKKLRF